MIHKVLIFLPFHFLPLVQLQDSGIVTQLSNVSQWHSAEVHSATFHGLGLEKKRSVI